MQVMLLSLQTETKENKHKLPSLYILVLYNENLFYIYVNSMS